VPSTACDCLHHVFLPIALAPQKMS